MPQREKILETFGLFCQPYKDEKGGPKLEAVSNFLENISKEWVPGIGLIVNKQENPKKVVVSHMDLIKTFRKGFAENKTFEIVDGEVVGALDNTITNAVLAEIIIELRDTDALQDIEFLFSEGEEVGMIGMKNYLKAHKQRVEKAFFINLDVTNEGYDKHVSLEYDKPNFSVIKQFQRLIGEHSHFTGDRVCDDTDAIIRADCHGLSVCLPTSNTIHSYKNKCRIESLSIYKEALKILILDGEFDYNEIKSDIKANQVEISLEHDLKENLPVQKSYNSLYDEDWGSSFMERYGSDSYSRTLGSRRTPSWDDDPIKSKRHSLWEDEDDKEVENEENFFIDLVSLIRNRLDSFSRLPKLGQEGFLSKIEQATLIGEFDLTILQVFIPIEDINKIIKFLKPYGYTRLGNVYRKEPFIDDEFLQSEWISEMSDLSSLHNDCQENSTRYRRFIMFFSNKYNEGVDNFEIEELEIIALEKFNQKWLKEAEDKKLIAPTGGGSFFINYNLDTL